MDKSFSNTCLLMCTCLELHPRGGRRRAHGVCSSCKDPEVQLTRVAVYAFWILWSCHKWRGQPCLLSALQSNLGGTVLNTEIQNIWLI